MKIKEVFALTGISKRTLHYYDEIGLLCPSSKTKSGYRTYNQDELKVLQQIMFFKELNFTLNDIKGIIKNPDFRIDIAMKKTTENTIIKEKPFGILNQSNR
jgi:DNA-binding transcriptional MerR regulator